MFKKLSGTKRSTNIRKRPIAETEKEDDKSCVLIPEKQPKLGHNEIDESRPEQVHIFNASGVASSLLPNDMGATAVQEIDTVKSRDSTAILERTIELQKDLEGKEDDKLYRGQAGYAQYFKKRDTAAGNAVSSKVRIGPVRASSNIRVTARFDYQPDICKDYKETGFCGYGDSCKFLHDRGDYKAGWEIEKEWEIETKKKREMELKGVGSDNELEDNNDDLQSLCLICQDSLKFPIVTKCGHYFCEDCAIKEFQSSPKCFACGENTNGIFNVVKIIDK